jgi:hypothetical protein
MEDFKKFEPRKAAYVAALCMLLSIALHILVILGKLSHTEINGGRIETYETTAMISYINIAALAVFIVVFLFGAGIIPTKQSKTSNMVLKVIVWAATGCLAISALFSFFGTNTDIFLFGMLSAMTVYCGVRIAIE